MSFDNINSNHKTIRCNSLTKGLYVFYIKTIIKKDADEIIEKHKIFRVHTNKLFGVLLYGWPCPATT